MLSISISCPGHQFILLKEEHLTSEGPPERPVAVASEDTLLLARAHPAQVHLEGEVERVGGRLKRDRPESRGKR